MSVCSGHITQLWPGQWFSKCGEGDTGAEVSLFSGYLRRQACNIFVLIYCV